MARMRAAAGSKITLKYTVRVQYKGSGRLAHTLWAPPAVRRERIGANGNALSIELAGLAAHFSALRNLHTDLIFVEIQGLVL